jgi:hypothetical protein
VGHFAVAVVGLALAAWGHLLLRGAPGVVAVWVRMDNLFPPMFRSPPELAGYALFGVGAGLAVAGVVA